MERRRDSGRRVGAAPLTRRRRVSAVDHVVSRPSQCSIPEVETDDSWSSRPIHRGDNQDCGAGLRHCGTHHIPQFILRHSCNVFNARQSVVRHQAHGTNCLA